MRSHPLCRTIEGVPGRRDNHISDAQSLTSSGHLGRTFTRWWPLWLFVGALAVRLHWTLIAHPIDGFLYSDMRGYNTRANALLSNPFRVQEYRAFYPYGTTWLLAGTKFIFGTENFSAVAVIQSLLGSFSVLWTYFLSLRISKMPTIVAPAVGTLMVIYYPVLSLTGYTLSETPAIFLFTASALLTVRVVDERAPRDLWLLGLTMGVAMIFRPQLVLGFVLLFGVALWRRDALPLPRKIWWAFIPILVILVFSSARLHYHTGRIGTISENGAVNLIFGRCHNKGIYSRPDGKGHGSVRFGPPPFIQLERHSVRQPDSWMHLSPAFGDLPEGQEVSVDGVEGFAVDTYGCRNKGSCNLRGAELQYKGYIGDQATQKKIVAACIERTGWKRQLQYSYTHLVQLWAFNEMWPEQANPKPRAVDRYWRWGRMTASWKVFHNRFLLAPLLLSLVLCWRRRHARLWFASAHLFALLLVATFILGGIRFRVVYDPLILVLALEVYGLVGAAVWRKYTRARRR